MRFKNIRDRHRGRRLDLGISIVNGSRNRAASRRPMVDLPAPIMPTSTIDRDPKAAVISASRVGLACVGKAASDIKKALVGTDCRILRHLYYPRRYHCQSHLQRLREHVG